MPDEFGEHLTRDQRIRISPDPSDSHIHVGASSLQLSTLIRDGHGRSFILCSVTDFGFDVCFMS